MVSQQERGWCVILLGEVEYCTWRPQAKGVHSLDPIFSHTLLPKPQFLTFVKQTKNSSQKADIKRCLPVQALLPPPHPNLLKPDSRSLHLPFLSLNISCPMGSQVIQLSQWDSFFLDQDSGEAEGSPGSKKLPVMRSVCSPRPSHLLPPGSFKAAHCSLHTLQQTARMVSYFTGAELLVFCFCFCYLHTNQSTITHRPTEPAWYPQKV